jgi:hypothetical protein
MQFDPFLQGRLRMEALSSYFGLGVSICTALATFYFWIVKFRQEQPRLKIYKAEPQVGGHAQSACSDPIKLVFDVKTVVANYSSLPNAVLGAQSWVRMRDGSWCDAETRLDPRTQLPLNLASLQTVRLDLSVTVGVPAVPEGNACKNTNEAFVLYRDRFMAQPLEVKVGLKTLGEKLFADVLTSARRAA